MSRVSTSIRFTLVEAVMNAKPQGVVSVFVTYNCYYIASSMFPTIRGSLTFLVHVRTSTLNKGVKLRQLQARLNTKQCGLSMFIPMKSAQSSLLFSGVYLFILPFLYSTVLCTSLFVKYGEVCKEKKAPSFAALHRTQNPEYETFWLCGHTNCSVFSIKDSILYRATIWLSIFVFNMAEEETPIVSTSSKCLEGDGLHFFSCRV